MKQEILRLEDAQAQIGPNGCLRGCSLYLFRGEMVGLVGDNVYEKNCLVEVLCGRLPLHDGRIYFNDALLEEGTEGPILRSKIMRIGMQSSLVENLSVAENIFLLRPRFKKWVFSQRKLQQQADLLFREYQLSIDPCALAEQLPLLQRCEVELVKSVAAGAKVIILQEPTSFLGTIEQERLFKTVEKMRKKGISFLIIDSYLDMLKKFCTRIVLMKDGKDVRNLRRDQFLNTDLRRFLSFQSTDIPCPPAGQENALIFHNLCTDRLMMANLTVKRGEIVNILDLSGECIRDIAALLNGTMRQNFGIIEVDNRLFEPVDTANALRLGVGYLPENPTQTVLLPDLSVIDNLCICMEKKVSKFWRFNKLSRNVKKQYRPMLGPLIDKKSLYGLGFSAKQKICYYKWHLFAPKVLVCLRPFANLDFIMRDQTASLMTELAAKKIAVLILTSSLEEAYLVGRRVVVIDNGQIIGEDTAQPNGE